MIRAALIALLVAALAVPSVEAASLVQRRRELQDLLSQLTLHRLRLRQVRRQEHRVLGELEGIDRTREDAERRLAELTTELGRTQSRAHATATKLAVTERELEARRDRFRGRLRDIYKYGRTSYVEVLLGADDFGELLARWHFVSTIVRADASLITEYADDVQRYRTLRTELQHERVVLRRIAARTEARRRDVVVQEQAKRTMLRRLREERAAYERMVRELEENSRELEVLIRRAQSAGRLAPTGVARGWGRFLWPARGVFTSGFGYRRHPIFGIRRLHTGQDIAAPRGAPVLAAADGRVMYTGWFGGYGKIVILDHGDGVSTLYAHLSAILVRSGAAVRRGQPIGRVGSTGYSTGPHVHFEIRINGRPINPARR